MRSHNKSIRPLSFHQGVSAVELMITLAILVILIAVAAPAFEAASVRSDMKAAADDISQAIRLAKNTARTSGQPVVVSITAGSTGNSIRFTFANGTSTSAEGFKLPSINLSDKIAVSATQTTILFDPMGMIVNFDGARNIVLTSTLDASVALTVKIVNKLGYITVARNVTGVG